MAGARDSVHLNSPGSVFGISRDTYRTHGGLG